MANMALETPQPNYSGYSGKAGCKIGATAATISGLFRSTGDD